MKRLTTEDFILRSNIVHNGRYDYSLVEYTLKGDKVNIICLLHGKFSQNANAHMRGFGCSKCGNIRTTSYSRSTKETFIEQASAIHEFKYDYTLFEYIHSKHPSTIVCPVHGEFRCSPDNHKRGKACPSCAKYGYNSSKSGIFYILDVYNECLKFGITNNIKRRLKELRLNSEKSIVVLHQFEFVDGSIPDKIENDVINCKEIEKGFLDKLNMPDGYTETTPYSSLPLILQIVEKYTPT